MHRIIIDTDPGIDDAMAIFYAFASPDIEVLGLTTIFGNVAVDLATENALRLVEIAGHSGVPVARGAAHPLTGRYGGAVEAVHGGNGQGDAALKPPAGTEHSVRATEFIYRTVMDHPGEITLVTLGPLTNIALLLLERPEIAAQVRGVVAMGGNVWAPGNATPAAEANIVNDPEAADIVLSAPWPVTICGLDVTHRVTMTPEDLARIYRVSSPQGRHLAAIVPFYHAFYEAHVGSHGIYVHDSTTISYLLHPDAFETERLPLQVDTGSGAGRGKTWPVRRSGPLKSRPEGEPRNNTDDVGRRPDVTVCRDVDASRVVEAEIAALESTVR